MMLAIGFPTRWFWHPTFGGKVLNLNPGLIMFTTAVTSAFLDIALKLSLRPVSPTPRHKEISYGCPHLHPQEKLSNFFMYCQTFLCIVQLFYLSTFIVLPSNKSIPPSQTLPNSSADPHPSPDALRCDKPTVAEESLPESERATHPPLVRESNHQKPPLLLLRAWE